MGGVAALAGALIEAKPEVVGGGRVSYVEDICLAGVLAGGVFRFGSELSGARGAGEAGRPLMA